MTTAVLLHERTKISVAKYLAEPTHAMILLGNSGVGKTHLAKAILNEALNTADVQIHPYVTIVRPDKGSISIQAIRELQHFLQLKTPGTAQFRRGIIIEHADSLTIEAQNAFLKLLEEPPADTLILLTADNQRALLPTILSRTQLITVYAPSEAAIKEHFAEQGKSAAKINQAYFLSEGLPGLMHALLADETAHPLMSGVATAKELLGQPLFAQLARVDSLSKQKDEVRNVLDALQRIAQTGIKQATIRQDVGKLQQWHHILKVTAESITAIEQNANAKLVLSNMLLSL